MTDLLPVTIQLRKRESHGTLPGIVGQFPVICADPPWSYRTFSDKGKNRSADHHYRTMTLADIAALPVGAHAAKNTHLLLWITGPPEKPFISRKFGTIATTPLWPEQRGEP